MVVYNEFKPPGSVDRTPDQIRKKFGRITTALRKFIGIYENQLRTAESGRSEADVKSLSMQLFNVQVGKKFTYWAEFLVLRDSPKFRAICENASDSGPSRTRRGRGGNCSSSSGGSRTFDLNDEVMEEPPCNYPGVHGPWVNSPQSEPLDPPPPLPPNTLLRARLHPPTDRPERRCKTP